MKKFARHFTPNQKVLDIGCGYQPYKHFFNCHYTSLDHTADLNPDIVSPAWSIPLPDNSFDGIILNQVLEHTAKLDQTINEIRRLLKPGSLAIITVPQTMKNHSVALPINQAPTSNLNSTHHPYWQVDYYRFTKYGLSHLFQDFTILSLTESNGYFGTIFQLFNYFLASFSLGAIFSPIYLINNILGLTLDCLGQQTKHIRHPLAQKFYYFTYSSLTINLILIIRKGRNK